MYCVRFTELKRLIKQVRCLIEFPWDVGAQNACTVHVINMILLSIAILVYSILHYGLTSVNFFLRASRCQWI